MVLGGITGIFDLESTDCYLSVFLEGQTYQFHN